jgi:DNA-binding LacI/PurR family transcriptional regulator
MEITVSRDNSIPLHLQLLNAVRHRILSAEWPAGSRIPSEHAFQQSLGISRSTIRQALRAAEAEGLIESVPGKGSFVCQTPASQGTPRLIGFVIPYFRSSFDSQLLRGAESVAKAKGYRVIFCNSERRVQEEDRQLQLLVQDRVAGIIIWPVMSDDSHRLLFRLAAQGISLSLMDRSFPGLETDLVLCDNYGGAYAATQHLIALGHRRIAFLGRSYLHLLPIAERLQGYRQAMQEAGLEPLAPLLVGIPQEMSTDYALRTYTDASGEDIPQIMRYLASSPGITAIFAMNDLMALAVLKAANLMGIKVPQKLSVVGFDDLDFVSQLEVPLTTVAQDPFALGQQAATLLFDRVEHRTNQPRRVILPTHLVVRASTASSADSL